MPRTLLTFETALYTAGAPAGFILEARDCAVRALSVAANVPYARAHAALARAGRPARKGTRFVVLERTCPILGGIRLRNLARVTLARFIAEQPAGRYLMVRRGHAFALINGTVHDWGNTGTGARSRVFGAWAFPGAQYRAGAIVLDSASK